VEGVFSGYARCVLISMLKTTVVFRKQNMDSMGICCFVIETAVYVCVSRSVDQVLLFYVRCH
jgi:hypothetical protein